MSKSRLAILMVCATLIALSAAPTLAQPAAPGKITGSVRDASGAAVVGATITITHQDTGVTRVVKSVAGGTFEATDLPPGLYTVSADQQGFRKLIQRDRRLAENATLTLSLVLELKAAESVTVSAMKREDTVQNTPISVTAATEDSMRERGIQNVEDVAQNVANFSVQNLGPGQSTVAIRGVSSGQIARDQPGVKEEVASYLDESSISMSLFTPDIDFFDMNRVEVLRGPQGTLFGSGSVGGTVRYITNQPQLGINSVFGEIGGVAIDGGGMGGDFKVGFNAPLGSKVALRVAGYYNRLAGYIDAVQPDMSVKTNVNAGDRTGVRLALEIAPIEGLTITPRFAYQKVSMEGWNREDAFNILANPYTTTRPPVTLGPLQQFTQIDEPFTDKFSLGDLVIKYDFGSALLTSITSFTKRDILVVRDAGALTSSITGGSIGLPAKVYTLNSPLFDATGADGWTQEVRVSGGKEKDRFRWVLGGFYADLNRNYDQRLVVNEFTALSGIPTKSVYAPTDVLFWSKLGYKLHQYALFGEGTFAVTPSFRVTAGLRYYNFTEDKTQIFDGIFGEGADGKPQIQPGTVKADGVAPRFIASYDVSPSTTINAQASKGFRLGGVNDPLNVNLCTAQDLVTFSGRDTWQDETAWNYEIGSKSRIFGGRGSVNVSAFYVDLTNLQVTVTAGSCSSRLIFNVPKARSVGGELEFAYAPTDSFNFSVSGGYADSQVRSTIPGTLDLQYSTGIIAGNRLPAVPKLQVAASVTYEQPLGDNYLGYATANYSYVGSRYTQIADQEPGVGIVNIGSYGANTIGGPLTQSIFTFDPLLPAYNILNLRLGVRRGIWDFAFYINNITDEHAELALDRERGLKARVGFLTNQPRTFGLNYRVDF